MRKIAVLTTIVGICFFLLSIIAGLLWLSFNSFPSKMPNWANICFIGSFLVMIIGLLMWLYTEKDYIVSEIKKLYN